MACEVEFDSIVTEKKLEELKLRHPAVGCAYRLGMYFDTVNSLPRGFDALPENDGYSSYFEETDIEDDGFSELMFTNIPGDSASVVDMETAEQLLLSRASKKSARMCHAMHYRTSSFVKYPNTILEDPFQAAKANATYNKSSIYTAASSSGYGTGLLSPQSTSQPEHGLWNNSPDSRTNSQDSDGSRTTQRANDKASSPYRSKPLPKTPLELVTVQRPQPIAVDDCYRKKLYDVRQNSNTHAITKHPLTQKLSGSIQTINSQHSVMSGDYSRPWDLKKSVPKNGIARCPTATSLKQGRCSEQNGRMVPAAGPLLSTHTPAVNGSANVKQLQGAAVKTRQLHCSSSTGKLQGVRMKKEFGKYLQYEPEHIYESITDDNDYEEIPDDPVPTAARGLNQRVHSLTSNNFSLSQPTPTTPPVTTVIPLSAVSSAGKPKRCKSEKSLKKSGKSNATIVSSATNQTAETGGSLRKKGVGKRRATLPETMLAKSKPRTGSQPEIINYGIV